MSAIRELPPKTDKAKLPSIPHIVATYEGEYFKGVVGAMEVVPFKEDVLIPHTWLAKGDGTADPAYAAYIFRAKFAKKILGKKPGFSDVRTVRLVDTTELPPGLTVDQELIWTADFSKLVSLAQKYAKAVHFVPLDPKEGTPLPRESASVKPEYYADAADLRNAIRRCMSEPQAFKVEQEKLGQGYETRKNEMTMQEEMDALYPDGF